MGQFSVSQVLLCTSKSKTSKFVGVEDTSLLVQEASSVPFTGVES